MVLPGQNRISVALCTYNGERFLPQQLASIQQQTRLPDEVVVCDDRSTDRTVEMVRAFAASVSFPVRVIVNERNLGSAANFAQAIELCAGNLVALSDQDDIWYPIRLERSEQELTEHPEAGLVFSDGDIIDDRDQLVGTRLWTYFGFAGEVRDRLLAGDYTVVCDRSNGDVSQRTASGMSAHWPGVDSRRMDRRHHGGRRGAAADRIAAHPLS
jgi:glycosyltransferase involved in cell wall biosynthesis